MFFNSENFSANLISVSHLVWNAANHKVKARRYDALALRLAGKGKFKFQDESVIETSAGEILFLPRELAYEVDYSDGEIMVFHFTSNPISVRAETVAVFSLAHMTELFSEALRLWKEKKSGYRMAATAVFYNILALMASEDRTSPQKNLNFCRALTYLEENYSDPALRISEICCGFGISETVFRRIFAEDFGRSPVIYLTELRLRAAEQMLLTENKTVEAVALECGFNDVKYFSRVVKKYRGCTPSQLRGEL